MPRKKPIAPPTPAPVKLNPEERAELLELRNDYDPERPTEVKMIPVPHHRLKRLVELERQDVLETRGG